MKKIIILGNAGSGKSTLAKTLAKKYDLVRLDLDTLAWTDQTPPKRKTTDESAITINRFLADNEKWVVEGCYADLVSLFTSQADKLLFLNPGVEVCMRNCKQRPWEPHKYKTMEEQNRNLAMLLDWVKQYPHRTDDMSLSAHQNLHQNFSASKNEYTENMNLRDFD